MNTPNTIKDRENERIEEFLRLLKTNPKAIERQVVKNEYKQLLEIAFEKAKSDLDWAERVVPYLLKLNILGESDKKRYKQLLETVFEEAKSNYHWALGVVPELLKLKILDESEIKESYKQLLETAFEKAKTHSDWARYVVPELLKLNILDESDKKRYKQLLEIAFEKAKSDYDWAKRVVPELLKLNILDESDKKRYKQLLETAFEKAKTDYDWAKEIVPELLKLKILDESDKKRYKQLLETAFEKAETHSYWAEYVVPELLKLKILDESEIKESYKQLLEIAFEEAKSHYDWARYVVPELLKLKILDESEIKESYKQLLEIAFEEAKSYSDWAIYIVPALLELKILDESEIKESYKQLLETAFEKAKTHSDWARYVVPELLKLNILDESDKKRYKQLLETAFEKAKIDSVWAEYVVPELLKLKILDESEIKESYKQLLEIAFVKEKSDPNWALGVVPELLKLNILDESDKKRYKQLLETAFEKAKSDSIWAGRIVPELLKLKILDESEIKKQYKQLLETAFEKAKTHSDWARYVVPELLKLNILDESEINIDIILPQNITLTGTSFLEKNEDKMDEKDIEFINQIDECLSKEEINYLYRQDYEFFKKVEGIIKENNFQKIWEIKKEIYPKEEIQKLRALEDYFGEGVWKYFVDKVPGNKTIKNRFRDPHNALLHADKVIELAKQLESKGISKEEFVKNYLGIAGDRNNGYQQLNDFLEKYKSDWKGLVESAKDIDEFKGNTEFKDLTEGILEQERTGELYKNLDNLEQILTLLHMIGNNAALIQLQKLAESSDPNDKKLYEYYKGAIYHPRTKPIIMKMYENPGEFLGLDDTTFRDLNKIHQAKKPSNMVENFEFLDFDAKDLVNCLPLGVYDKLSYFKPFEMRFYINGSDVYTKEELQHRIEILLNRNQTSMSPLCKRLYNEKKHIKWYQMRQEDPTIFVQTVLQEYGIKEFINKLGSFNFSGLDKYKNLRKMTAKISPKSDPNNWFNGFNCDSLAEGHGKKVVAMFNPYCTDFCIYEGDQDPKEDNLKVTSWVTLNRAIPENFTTLLNKVKSETTHDIANVLGDKFEDYKDPSEYVITMDNIEANPNFGSKNELAVRKMYEKFFSEYVKQNPMSPNGIPINTHKFYSGVNYNKLDIFTHRVPNENLPVFINAYSDNSASESLQGNLDAGEQKEKQKKIGIRPLSIEDVVQISYMEGKIYPSSMKDHLGNLQHEITASILNNTLKGRPNLSFARYNEEGKIGGYILAYQGKMEDGTPGVYISDFAMDEKERGTAGIKMIHHWMKEVKEKYPDMPVFTRARENTSYRMIKAFSEKQGYEIVKDEIMEDGGEKFHWIVMNPKK